MRNLIILSFICLLFACTPKTAVIPTPADNPKSVYRTNGVQDLDTSFVLTYETYICLNNGTKTHYTQVHEVIDTTTLQGQEAFVVSVTTPFGNYTYKIASDSTTVWKESEKYSFDRDTMIINSCGAYGILTQDSSVTILDSTFINPYVIRIPKQACFNADVSLIYSFGRGLVSSVIITGGDTTTMLINGH